MRRPAPTAAEERALASARTLCAADLMWVVRHHVDKHDIVLANTDPRQTVRIFGCRNCTIQARLGTAWGAALASCKVLSEAAWAPQPSMGWCAGMSWSVLQLLLQVSEEHGQCSRNGCRPPFPHMPLS